MKWLRVAFAAVLSGCAPTPHRFDIDAERADIPVTAAHVSLCDEPAQPLERRGTRFVGSIALHCEGSGYVRLQFADGITTDCPVSYVTSLEDHWRFKVRGRACTMTMTGS